MLDLNILERKLDAALAQETPESLSRWLAQQRTTASCIPADTAKPVIVPTLDVQIREVGAIAL